MISDPTCPLLKGSSLLVRSTGIFLPSWEGTLFTSFTLLKSQNSGSFILQLLRAPFFQPKFTKALWLLPYNLFRESLHHFINSVPYSPQRPRERKGSTFSFNRLKNEFLELGKMGWDHYTKKPAPGSVLRLFRLGIAECGMRKVDFWGKNRRWDSPIYPQWVIPMDSG